MWTADRPEPLDQRDMVLGYDVPRSNQGQHAEERDHGHDDGHRGERGASVSILTAESQRPTGSLR
jgi:hypothetical protein